MELLDVPYFYKPLSLRLCRILNNIGASEKLRKLATDSAFAGEIAFSLIRPYLRLECPTSCYIFGSTIEGTSTAGLQSDNDFLFCWHTPEVFQNLSDHGEKKSFLLMVKDVNTKQGYTKLQVVKNLVPLTKLNSPEEMYEFAFDSKDRLVMKHIGLFRTTDNIDSTVHGPADCLPATPGVSDQDFVSAFRCCSWPEAASEWLLRQRQYGWPSNSMIEQMKTLGFFLVPAGHRQSIERDLEWRISLSLQERLLMLNLNPTQFKCYILLKMVKKDAIKNKLGEDSISSYHCKTCLFYMIENTPRHFWIPENLLTCFQECLKCFARWVKNGECPNYFIPGENMFDGRVYGDVKKKLQKIMKDLIESNFSFLLGIRSDDVGREITNSVFQLPVLPQYTSKASLRRLDVCMGPAFSLLTTRSRLLEMCSNTDKTEFLRNVFRAMCKLSSENTVMEYIKGQTKQIASFILPYIETSVISISVVNLVLEGATDEALNILFSSKWQDISARTDCFSVRLKQATFLFMLGQHLGSLKILETLDNKCGDAQMSLCSCRLIPKVPPLKLCYIAEERKFFYEEFLKFHVVACAIFTKFEKDLMPTALVFEIIKSVHMPSNSWSKLDSRFFSECALVDGKILLYFLLFLNHSQLNMQAHVQTDISNMEWVYNTDPNLRHRETALNILGWCFKIRGNVEKAMKCFYESLTLQKQHNAAFWHILVTLNERCLRKNKNRVLRRRVIRTKDK